MNVLLLGSSSSALPLLFDLKSRGFVVTVMGKYEDDPCHRYADNSIYLDYSESSSLFETCRISKFDYIVPSCNDYAYRSAAWVANEFGYPGYDNLETAAVFLEKDKFRKTCSTLSLPAPQVHGEFQEIGHLQSFMPTKFPLLVKPVDSFSGRGVQLVHAVDRLLEAAALAFKFSRCNRIIVEEYVSGSLHSHTALVSKGQIVWFEIVDEFCEVYPYQVDRSIFPSTLSGLIRNRVNESISVFVERLGIVDGLLHTQFIATDDKFWLIETMRRCPGDLYGHHFHFADGRNYAREYVSAFLGITPKVPEATKPIRRVERRVISTAQAHTIFGFQINTGGRNSTMIPLKQSGEILKEAPFDKAAIVFLEENPYKTAIDFSQITTGSCRYPGAS